MKKRALAAAGAALAVAAGLSVFAWHDQNANEAAQSVTTHPVVTPTPTSATSTDQSVCLQALEHADATIELTADGFDILGDALQAAGNNDYGSVGNATRNMTLFNQRLAVALAKYRESRDACKAAGR